MQIKVLLAAATLAAANIPVAAQADALQAQVLAAAQATPRDAYAFRQTTTFDRTGGARTTFVDQFDPRRPAGEQWTLVNVDGRAPTSKELADSRKRKRGKTPSYAAVADWFGGPATRSDPAPGSVLYRFARLPAGTLKMGSHDASPDTQAEALVNTRGKTPFVERVRFVSTKDFTMMLVASLKSMTADARYRLLPDGRAVPAETASTITGSMMGKSGQMKTSTTYADFVAVR